MATGEWLRGPVIDRYDDDYRPAIIDNGPCELKSGISREDALKVSFLDVLAHRKLRGGYDPNEDYHISEEAAQRVHGIMQCEPPMPNGYTYICN